MAGTRCQGWSKNTLLATGDRVARRPKVLSTSLGHQAKSCRIFASPSLFLRSPWGRGGRPKGGPLGQDSTVCQLRTALSTVATSAQTILGGRNDCPLAVPAPRKGSPFPEQGGPGEGRFCANVTESKLALLATRQAGEPKRPGVEARKRLFSGSRLTEKIAG